jgi:hypothetical protein
VVFVGDRAEVGVDPGDQIVGHKLPISAAAGTTESKTAGPAGARSRALATTSASGLRRTSASARPGGWRRTSASASASSGAATRAADVAGFHHCDEGLDFARRKQVIENKVGLAHFDPDPLVLAAAVL